MKNKIEPKLYSIQDACMVMGGISKPTLYKYITDGKIDKVKFGKRSYIVADSIDRFIGKAQKAA